MAMRIRLLPFICAILAVTAGCRTQELAVSQFRGGAAAAVSMTFDDGSVNQIAVAAPMLHEFGMRATFYVVPGCIREKADDPLPQGATPDGNGGASWEELRAAAKMGHEIGNHSLTHAGLTGIKDDNKLEEEVEVAARLLDEKIGKEPRSFAYPFNSFDDRTRKVVLKRHVADRTSFVYGICEKFTLEDFNGYVDKAIADGDWILPLFHCIDRGYCAVDHELLRKHLQYIQSRRAEIWVDTVANVARYVQERSKAQITMKERKDRSVTFILETPLDPSIYDVPLTVVIPADDAKNVRVVPEQKSTDGKSVIVQKEQILVDVVPGKIPLTVTWE